MTKIAILDNIRALPQVQKEIQKLASHEVTFPDDAPSTLEGLVTRTGDADAVLVSTAIELPKEYFDVCPSVKYVGICGTSTTRVDLETLKARNIAFSNISDYGDEPTAEYIFLQLESIARGIGKYQWQEQPRELMGKSIGIIGLGALGKAIANLALAYKMDVRYFSAHRKPEWEERGLRYSERDELLQRSQIVVISTPTNVVTVSREGFDIMQPNSILVQASLGTPFDCHAFLGWITRHNNFAVFDGGAGEENLQIYRNLDRVIVSETSPSNTYETRERLGAKVVENLTAFVNSL